MGGLLHTGLPRGRHARWRCVTARYRLWWERRRAAAMCVAVALSSVMLPAPRQVAADGLILGKVVDRSSGRPVAHALVMRFGSADYILSDAEGRFVFFGLPPGAYRIAAAKHGYVRGEVGRDWVTTGGPLLRPLEQDPMAQVVTLRQGERRSDVVIYLTKEGVISGRVVDESGQPMVSVEVQAWPHEFRAGRSLLDWEFPATGRTDDRGEYRLSGLVPGEYAVAVPALSIAATGDQLVPSRAPEPDLLRTMILYGLSVGEPGQTLTPNGPWRYGRIGAVSPGARDGGPGPTAYPTTLLPGTTEAGGATLVRVDPGGETPVGDLQLHGVSVHSVSGTVAPEGSLSHTVTVRLLPADWRDLPPIATSVTGTDGQFEFVGVPEGRYVAEVQEFPQGPVRNIWQAGASDQVKVVEFQSSPLGKQPTFYARTDLTVGDDDVHDVTVPLLVGSRISGRIEFDGDAAQGQALEQVRLSVEASNGVMAPVQPSSTIGIRDDGTFESLGLPPADYFMRLEAAPPGWYLQSVTSGTRDISDAALTLQREDVPNVIVTLTREPPSVDVQVHSDDGRPDDRACVALFPVDPTLWTGYGARPRNVLLARVDEEGRHRFIGPPPGTYWIAALDQRMASEWGDPALFTKLSTVANRIQILAHAHTTASLAVPPGW